jgi:hypothetical protein
MVAKKWLFVVLLCLCAVSFAQDKRVYFGLRAGAGIGMSALTDKDEKDYYKKSDEEAYKSGGGSFDIAPFVSFQLADKFALGTEFLFTKYGYGGSKQKKDTDYEKKGDYSVTTKPAIVIPVLAQFTFAERKVKVFVGPHFSINTGAFESSWKRNGNKGSIKLSYYDEGLKYPPIGLTAGASFGFNAGPGNLFFDIRYLTDLGGVKIEYKDINYITGEIVTEEYDVCRRAKLGFSVGYEFGAGSR